MQEQNTQNQNTQEQSSTSNSTIANTILAKCKEVMDWCASNNYTYNVAVPSNTNDILSIKNEKGVCCASYVAWVLAEAGYEDVINECSNFRSSTELREHLKNYPNYFRVITDSNDLVAGDIIFVDGHTQIYAGNNMWYNGGGSEENPVTYTSFGAGNMNFMCYIRPIALP